jgi:hypothetical protein
MHRTEPHLDPVAHATPQARRRPLDLQVYYKAATDAVPAILDQGLAPDGSGAQRQDPLVRRTDAFLDDRCPPALAFRGLDRRRCVYCCLGVEGMVHDVETGGLVRPDQWDVGPDHTVLRLRVDPATAWIGDLDLYDRLAAHVRGTRHVTRPVELATRYWRRLVDLPTLATHFRPVGTALICDRARLGLPARLDRVEVLVTAAVPAERIDRVRTAVR